MSYGISLWGSLLNQEKAAKLERIQTTSINILTSRKSLTKGLQKSEDPNATTDDRTRNVQAMAQKHLAYYLKN